MRFIYPLFLLFFSVNLSAQCTVFDLEMLQSIQRAEEWERQNIVETLGFDLRVHSAEKVTPAWKRYAKCWKHSAGSTPIYDQLIIMYEGVNSVTFATLDGRVYQSLRTAIESRGNGVGSYGDIYIGKMFKYQFSQLPIDGNNYFAVTISPR